MTNRLEPHDSNAAKKLRVAILVNSVTHYRSYVYDRIVRELPDIDFWALSTHAHSFGRWQGERLPETIRHVSFGSGEPNNEQTKARYAIREWRKAGRVIRWIREHQIDVMFSQGFGDLGRLRLLRWCDRNGIPCYITGDNNVRGDNHWLPYRLLKGVVLGNALRWASGVCPSGRYGRELFERYGGKGMTVSYFPFMADVELFQHPPADVVHRARQQFELDPNRKRIVFSGRMMQVKRPDLAIAAFSRIAEQRRDWDLVMLGDGTLRESLIASVPAALRDRIRFTGFVHDMSLMAGVYALSDVLFHPTDKEPWGVVIQEAAAAGLGIVTTDVVGASPELVKQGRNGFSVAAGDLEAMVDALLQVTDEHTLPRYKSASREVLREWVDRYDAVDGFRRALEASGRYKTIRHSLDHQDCLNGHVLESSDAVVTHAQA